MPNNGKMECNYTENVREGVAQYYSDIAHSETFGVELHTNLSASKTKLTCTINDEEVENPVQEALDNGQCVIYWIQ